MTFMATYTYALLPVDEETYEAIYGALQHNLRSVPVYGEPLDMRGLAISQRTDDDD